MIRTRRFEQSNGLGHRASLNERVALHNLIEQIGWIQANAFLMFSSTSLALAGIGVPGP